MRNLHTMIIHHIRQVIGRMTIRLEQDRVIIHSIDEIQLTTRPILSGFAVDHVVVQRVSFDP